MKKGKKIFFNLVSIFLSTISLVSCLFPVYNHTENTNSPAVRTIESANLSYEDQVLNLVDEFDEYSISNTDCEISFDGVIPAMIGEVRGFDSLAEDTGEIKKRISSAYDYSTNEFFIEVSMFEGDAIIEKWTEKVEPAYDEERDEGFIEYEGNKYYLAECLGADTLNNCVAGVDDAAILSVGALACAALAITIVVTPPSVHQKLLTTVTQVTETICQAVRSFWGWFSSWITRIFTRTRTVTTTTVVTTYTPTLTLGGKKIETKEVSLSDLKNEKNYPEGEFYLCFVNKKIYVSLLAIKDYEAVAILKSGIVIKDNNTGKDMLASTFTRSRTDAYRIALAAGLNVRTPYEKPEYEYGAYHYHSSVTALVNGKIYSPHSFFLYLI